MKLQRLLVSTAIVAAVGLGLCGCRSSGNADGRNTTVGQELQDLDDARNKGLLTEDEYNKKRSEIMKRK